MKSSLRELNREKGKQVKRKVWFFGLFLIVQDFHRVFQLLKIFILFSDSKRYFLLFSHLK